MNSEAWHDLGGNIPPGEPDHRGKLPRWEHGRKPSSLRSGHVRDFESDRDHEPIGVPESSGDSPMPLELKLARDQLHFSNLQAKLRSGEIDRPTFDALWRTYVDKKHPL